MQTEALLKAFEKYVERHELFSHEDRVLLTVSGGVDSMVMLSIFVRLGYNIGVAHCNFGLRGKESDEDTEMVLHECEKILVDEVGRPILYKDDYHFAGTLYVTSLDPDYHIGQGFMPTTVPFMEKFMKWVTNDIETKLVAKKESV